MAHYKFLTAQNDAWKNSRRINGAFIYAAVDENNGCYYPIYDDGLSHSDGAVYIYSDKSWMKHLKELSPEEAYTWAPSPLALEMIVKESKWTIDP